MGSLAEQSVYLLFPLYSVLRAQSGLRVLFRFISFMQSIMKAPRPLKLPVHSRNTRHPARERMEQEATKGTRNGATQGSMGCFPEKERERRLAYQDPHPVQEAITSKANWNVLNCCC